ncbi:hypothetical protein ACI784_22170 [Geodermatophilus sp. SYSU D01186]
MSQVHVRSLAAIDADLHSCRIVLRDAEQELTAVRRRQEELADLEATLVVTIDARKTRVDHLLDERLHTDASPAEPVPVGTALHNGLTPLG